MGLVAYRYLGRLFTVKRLLTRDRSVIGYYSVRGRCRSSHAGREEVLPEGQEGQQ